MNNTVAILIDITPLGQYQTKHFCQILLDVDGGIKLVKSRKKILLMWIFPNCNKSLNDLINLKYGSLHLLL